MRGAINISRNKNLTQVKIQRHQKVNEKRYKTLRCSQRCYQLYYKFRLSVCWVGFQMPQDVYYFSVGFLTPYLVSAVSYSTLFRTLVSAFLYPTPYLLAFSYPTLCQYVGLGFIMIYPVSKFGLVLHDLQDAWPCHSKI